MVEYAFVFWGVSLLGGFQANFHKWEISPCIFRHASVSSTYPCPSVCKSVGWSHFRISNPWSVMVAQIKKFKKPSPFIFLNFASGRTLPIALWKHFRAFKPSYTFLWLGRVLPEAKFENRWILFFELFDLIDRYWPEIGNPKVWLTNQRTDQLTWVGARDTCVSKNYYWN